jgi:predicted nucleotidyltransferase
MKPKSEVRQRSVRVVQAVNILVIWIVNHMSYTKTLADKDLIRPPEYVKSQIQYEVMMGSVAYGVSSDTSDIDIYGFCIPNKELIFPHLAGQIDGFGRQIQKFEQYQQHHVKDLDSQKEYDITIYNIVKYFHLCMENNPNMIDSLFVPRRCILHTTQIGDLVRENRRMFLHKGSWFKFKGYAFSQIHKMKSKNPIGKRKETIDKFGYDIKFAYHTCRLLNEVEQILIEGDLDLERNREQLKSIRRGEWTMDKVIDYSSQKERDLESVYSNSKLRHTPDEESIKKLLLTCLESHFGSLDKLININNSTQQLVKDITNVLSRYGV